MRTSWKDVLGIEYVVEIVYDEESNTFYNLDDGDYYIDIFDHLSPDEIILFKLDRKDIEYIHCGEHDNDEPISILIYHSACEMGY